MWISYDPSESDFEVPEKYCNCWHCTNFDGGWMVCKLACNKKGIATEPQKAFDDILYAMDENSEEFKMLERKEDDYCDDFDPDYEEIGRSMNLDYDPYDDLTPREHYYYRYED